MAVGGSRALVRSDNGSDQREHPEFKGKAHKKKYKLKSAVTGVQLRVNFVKKDQLCSCSQNVTGGQCSRRGVRLSVARLDGRGRVTWSVAGGAQLLGAQLDGCDRVTWSVARGARLSVARLDGRDRVTRHLPRGDSPAGSGDLSVITVSG